MSFSDIVPSDSLILKEDSLNHKGIVDYLAASNSPANALISNKSTSDNAILVSNVISKAYTNCVYATNAKATDICQNINITIEKIRKDTSNVIASFDELSTMVVNSFLPLTNIRQSKFSFLKNIAGNYSINTINGIAFLTDNAILARNVNAYTNNAKVNSRIIFDKNSFLSVNNNKLSSSIQSIRDNVVASNYNATPNTRLISGNTVDALINQCLPIVNHIITAYPCEFSDNSILTSNSISVTYHKNNSLVTSSFTYTKYIDEVVIQKYLWNDLGNQIFSSWKTSNNITYTPGTKFIAINNLDLYPNVSSPFKVMYVFNNYAFLSNYINSETQTANTNNTLKLKKFGDFTPNNRFTNITGSVYHITDNSLNWGELSAEFLFWSTNPNANPWVTQNTSLTGSAVNCTWKTSKYYTYANTDNNISYNEDITILLTKNITLYPIFKIVTINFNNSKNDTIRYFFSSPYNATTPNNLLEYTYNPGHVASNIGTNMVFAVEPNVVHKIPSNIQGEIFASDLTVTFNNGNNNNLMTTFNGFVLDNISCAISCANDDGENPRPFYTVLGGTASYSDKPPIRGKTSTFRISRNSIQRYTLSNNNFPNTNYVSDWKAMGAFQYKNKPNSSNIQNGRLMVFFTDWVGPKNKVHMASAVNNLTARIRLYPNDSFCKNTNRQIFNSRII